MYCIWNKYFKMNKNTEQQILEQIYEQIINKQQPIKKPTTFGDLLKIIQGIQLKNKGSKLLDKGVNFTVDQVLGLIPGASNAKTAFDFLKTAFERPDTKKTGTIIDKLNVDDQVAAIVDGSIEQQFLQHLAELIKQHGLETPIPLNWNVTHELQAYLQKNFNNRTVNISSNKH